MKLSKTLLIEFIMAVILSFNNLALAKAAIKTTTNPTFDEQRPDNISDKKWGSLKAVVQEAKLIAGDGAANDWFGISVSLSGDRALVGSFFNEANTMFSGSAYIFELSGGSWSQTAKLTAGDGATLDYFGSYVSLSGDRALVGAYGDDDNGSVSGSAYIFELSGGSWSQTAKLIAGDGAANDRFGYSVSLSGARALVGAYSDDDNGTNSGSAYIFDLSGVSWSQTAKLTAGDGAENDQFGISVSLSGGRALVGAYSDDDNGSDSGSAYIFDLSGGSWSQTAKLTAGDGAANDRFGISVSLSGGRALVGSDFDDDKGTNSGSAYIFELSGVSWSQTAKLTAGDGAANDHFGYSVSLSGDIALVGAYSDDDIGSDSGSAYIINLNPKYSISGNITGLSSGNTVELENNVTDTQSFSNVAFVFATKLSDAATYDVKVSNTPTTPNQTCAITGGSNGNGTGTINLADVTNIAVVCTITKYSFSVKVSGLGGGSLVLQNNTGDDLNILTDGNYTFATQLDDLSDYAVTVLTQPTSPIQTCSVSGGTNNDGTGVLAGENASVNVYCNTPPVTTANTYTAFEDIDLIVNDANGSVAGVNDDSVLVNDNDVDNDGLIVVNPGVFTTPGLGGEIILAADGTFVYVPPADVSGQDVLNFNVSDGIHTVASSLSIEVLPVNDAPSFSIQGDVLNASAHLDFVSNSLVITAFASNFVLGPADENTQSVAGFISTIFADSGSVLAVNGVTVNNAGDLSLDFTTNLGVAIVQLQLQDDGATTNGGEDTSAAMEFVVSYNHLVFTDGFEGAVVAKLFNYLDASKVKSPLQDYPIYDYENNVIVYKGHRLHLNVNVMTNDVMGVIKMWVDEIDQVDVLSIHE